jgi:hypothetical protein
MISSLAFKAFIFHLFILRGHASCELDHRLPVRDLSDAFPSFIQIAVPFVFLIGETEVKSLRTQTSVVSPACVTRTVVTPSSPQVPNEPGSPLRLRIRGSR